MTPSASATKRSSSPATVYPYAIFRIADAASLQGKGRGALSHARRRRGRMRAPPRLREALARRGGEPARELARLLLLQRVVPRRAAHAQLRVHEPARLAHEVAVRVEQQRLAEAAPASHITPQRVSRAALAWREGEWAHSAAIVRRGRSE